MKINYSNYLKGLFLSSLAGLISTDVNAKTYDLTKISENDNKQINSSGFNKDLTPKLILALNSDNTYSSIGHRSHRSHSSHRSHYSSYSGGGTNTTIPSTTPSSTTRSSTTTRTSTTTTSSPSQDLIQRTPKSSSTVNSYNVIGKNLGDRIIKEGMRGEDVGQLINILIKKGYLILQDGSTNVSGEYDYTTIIIDAVKEFQKNNNHDADGIVDVTTIYLLKNDSSK